LPPRSTKKDKRIENKISQTVIWSWLFIFYFFFYFLEVKSQVFIKTNIKHYNSMKLQYHMKIPKVIFHPNYLFGVVELLLPKGGLPCLICYRLLCNTHQGWKLCSTSFESSTKCPDIYFDQVGSSL
jgi:hypothetical protein